MTAQTYTDAQRTPQDYAVEHAGYLATAAANFIASVNEHALAQQNLENGDGSEDAVNASEQIVSDASSALRDNIYEFEKRRDRAIAERQAARSVAVSDEDVRVAPWTDCAGAVIRAGYTIVHPSGERGIVEFDAGEERPSDQWRVRYENGERLRLCLQVGDKGSAVVTSSQSHAVAGAVKVPDCMIVLLNHLESLMDCGKLKEEDIPTDMWNAVSCFNAATQEKAS